MKKTYIENLTEINKDELFEGLLGYGLFSDKIPPFLTSENFLEFCKNYPNGFNFSNKPRRYILYENMRNINVPRLLSIPHPIAYRNQCKILSENWKKLIEYFEKKTKNNTYKISRIHIRKILNTTKIFEMNYKNFNIDDYPEPKLLIGKKYIVKADISNCFPSIYSHSIAWALIGKQEAKNKMNKKYSSEWYNQIDEATRNLKDSETHGILIGPHSSNLISEIILVAIDEVLSKKYDYVRNIDDYTCYIKTYDEAEQFLINLSTELKKYNLTLNHKKTKILELPLASTEHWIRQLNTFIFNNKKVSLKEVRAFLDIAMTLMKENNDNSAILNYAIKVLSNKELTKNAQEYLIDTVHHLVLLYPYLINLLDKQVFEKINIKPEKIKQISEKIFEIGKEKKLYEAMSYALFFSIKYNFKLKEDLFEIIQNSNDTILMLLAYLHDEKFINHSKVRKKYKLLAESLKNDIDEYWLFVYEVLPMSKLTEEWKTMKKEKVTFIKQEFLKD